MRCRACPQSRAAPWDGARFLHVACVSPNAPFLAFPTCSGGASAHVQADAEVLTPTVSLDFAAVGRLEARGDDEDDEARQANVDAVLQKDAFLVFRALCKLSIRTSDMSSPAAELTAIRGKVCLPVQHLVAWESRCVAAPSLRLAVRRLLTDPLTVPRWPRQWFFHHCAQQPPAERWGSPACWSSRIA
jgi:hypothetical protein